MISRNTARVAATLVLLSGWSQASPAAPIGGVGAGCVARDNNTLYCRSAKADASIDLTRGPAICDGQTIHTASSVVFLSVTTKMRSARRNLCLKPDPFVPASYFQRQVR
jgi:hypothetical protein